MEDMESKLNAMLNDPAAMSRIIQMAQQLSGGTAQPNTPPPPPQNPVPPPPQDSGFDPMLLARILPLLQGDELRRGRVGDADCVMMRARAVWERGRQALHRDPYFFVDRVPDGEETC